MVSFFSSFHGRVYLRIAGFPHRRSIWQKIWPRCQPQRSKQKTAERFFSFAICETSQRIDEVALKPEAYDKRPTCWLDILEGMLFEVRRRIWDPPGQVSNTGCLVRPWGCARVSVIAISLVLATKEYSQGFQIDEGSKRQWPPDYLTVLRFLSLVNYEM